MSGSVIEPPSKQMKIDLPPVGLIAWCFGTATMMLVSAPLFWQQYVAKHILILPNHSNQNGLCLLRQNDYACYGT